jgi:5-methylcytosine-specific restriction protein A
MPSKWAAWYHTPRWRKLRKAFLAANPLCRECLGRGIVTRATEVHHKQPHKGDESLFWDSDNWDVLCKPCHDAHTVDDGVFGHGPSLKGCDEDGMPISNAHAWNRNG